MKKEIFKNVILLSILFSILMLSACKKALISIPFGADDCKGRPYTEIEANFKELGFKNIELVVVEDIILGLLAKEDMVSEVSIGGNRSFKKGDTVDPNHNVVISYHAKKFDKKNRRNYNKKI